MATLKTNYKDDMFSGDRKYREIRNSDGTVSFEDVTVYSQEGDVFASADINATNTEVNGINASLAQMNSDILWYGTCATAATTQAKVATTTDRKLGNLTTGQKVAIKMTYNNTHATPTLNVDGKGAKSIKAFGTTAPTVWWKAGDVVTFVYDGTNWIMGVTAGEIEQINASLTEKVSQYSDTTYSEAVKGLGYDPVSKKLCLIVEEGGADTPVPFSGTEAIISVQLIGRQGVFRAYNAQNKALLVGNGTTTINDTSVQLNILTSGGYTSGFKVTTSLPFQYAVLDSAGTFDNWVTGTSGGTIPAYQDTSVLLKF